MSNGTTYFKTQIDNIHKSADNLQKFWDLMNQGKLHEAGTLATEIDDPDMIEAVIEAQEARNSANSTPTPTRNDSPTQSDWRTSLQRVNADLDNLGDTVVKQGKAIAKLNDSKADKTELADIKADLAEAKEDIKSIKAGEIRQEDGTTRTLTSVFGADRPFVWQPALGTFLEIALIGLLLAWIFQGLWAGLSILWIPIIAAIAAIVVMFITNRNTTQHTTTQTHAA